MYVLIGGSIKGFGDITYDLNTFLQAGSSLNKIIPKENPIMIFAGSPCSDCLSLQIAKDNGYNVEYHLPCDGNPGEKLMKEYNDIEPTFRSYLLSLFDSMKEEKYVYQGHKERNDAIASKCDIFIAVTTFSHDLFLNPPEQIRKNSGTIYVWNKCEGKKRYHYSLLSKDIISG